MTTLTKAALMEAAKPRFAWVEVEGFGRVGIRSISNVKLTRREISYARDPEEMERSSVYPLIDQLMTDENTPMFDESDVLVLQELEDSKLMPLRLAIQEFNGNDQKKVSDESTDT